MKLILNASMRLNNNHCSYCYIAEFYIKEKVFNRYRCLLNFHVPGYERAFNFNYVGWQLRLVNNPTADKTPLTNPSGDALRIPDSWSHIPATYSKYNFFNCEEICQDSVCKQRRAMACCVKVFYVYEEIMSHLKHNSLDDKKDQ